MSCVISAGVGNTCKQAGGISRLFIASVPDVLNITPTRALGGKVTDIDNVSASLVFYEFKFEPNSIYFKSNPIGDVSLGFEKTCGGKIVGYSDATNELIEPLLRGRSIAIAIDNNGSAFLQGDVNPLQSLPSECGITEGVGGSNGYAIALSCQDGVTMREIDTTKIVYGTNSITVATV